MSFGAPFLRTFLRTAIVVVPLYLCALVAGVLTLAQMLADPTVSATSLEVQVIGHAVNLLEQPGQWLLEKAGAHYPGLYPAVLVEWLVMMAFNGLLWSFVLACVHVGLLRPALRKRANARNRIHPRPARRVAPPWSR
jgi:hypothetical protein